MPCTHPSLNRALRPLPAHRSFAAPVFISLSNTMKRLEQSYLRPLVKYRTGTTRKNMLPPRIELPAAIAILDSSSLIEEEQNLRAHVSSVADPDPGSGAFLTPGSGIRDG